MSRMISVLRGGVVFALLVLLCGGAAQAQGKWSKAAPFPEPEEELYGVTAGGKMYVMEGFGSDGVPVGMVWEYDPATDKWTKKKKMALPAHHVALVGYNNKIYAFGGYTLHPVAQGFGGWTPIDNAWEYDPSADTWKALSPMPTKRGSPVAVEAGGKIYVIGGAVPEPGSNQPAVFLSGPARSVGTNEVFDLATGTWESRSSMPTPRNHAFGGSVNGKIYVIGGRVSHPFIIVASNVDIVEEYDPATNTWGAAKAQMPTARSGGGWATYNGKIYVAGGETQTGPTLGAFRALEAYDPSTNTWQILPMMPTPRHGVAAGFLGNRLHLVSGKISSGGYEPGLHLSTGAHDVFEIPQ